MHGSEASAFTLFHQRESAEQQSSAFWELSLSEVTLAALRELLSFLLFTDEWRFNYFSGPDRTMDSHSTKEDIPELQVTRYTSRLSTDLNHTHAGVQEDGSFGLFGDLLIFVEVQVIGAVPELGQVEISPFKGLGQKCRYGI